MSVVSFQYVFELCQQAILGKIAPWLACAVILICWRVWRFTISPLLRPTEPKELPYWIPFLGHVFSFSTDYYMTLENAKRHFGATHEPYSLWIAGTRIYVCSSPGDVASLLGNTTTVNNPKLIDLMRWLGVSEEGITRFSHIDPAVAHNIGVKKPLAPASMMDEFHRRQLKSGEQVEDLIHTGILPEVNQVLKGIEDGAKSADGISMSLLSICSDMFVGGAAAAFLGNQIRESRPTLVDSFTNWERTCWKWAFKIPAMLSRDMLQARDGMIDALVGYFAIPVDDRQDAAYFIKATEAMLRDAGIRSHEDIARIFMVQFFNILSNVYKAAFWTIAYMLYEPSLVERIRSEIAFVVKDGKVQDESFISGSCPLLDSLMSETFRLTVASSLGRDIAGPTPITEDKILQPGSVLILPVHQLHFDSSVWGPNPRAMDLGRFAQDPKLYASRSYRPFGGGHSLCPARFFVKRVIGYAVASLVTKFDVHVDIERTRQKVGTKPLVGKQAKHVHAGGIDSINFPRVDLSKPSPGASLPVVQGEDVYVVLKRRS